MILKKIIANLRKGQDENFPDGPWTVIFTPPEGQSCLAKYGYGIEGFGIFSDKRSPQAFRSKEEALQAYQDYLNSHTQKYQKVIKETFGSPLIRKAIRKSQDESFPEGVYVVRFSNKGTLSRFSNKEAPAIFSDRPPIMFRSAEEAEEAIQNYFSNLSEGVILFVYANWGTPRIVKY